METREEILQLPAFLSETALQRALTRNNAAGGPELFELFGNVGARDDQHKSAFGWAHLTAKLVVLSLVDPDHLNLGAHLSANLTPTPNCATECSDGNCAGPKTVEPRTFVQLVPQTTMQKRIADHTR